MLNRTILIGGDKHIVTGRKRTRHGYIACCVKTHPYAGRDGYVFEHRLVLEQKHGEYILPGFDVHHINGTKDDNRPENLQILKHADHTRKTHIGLKRSLETRRKLSEWAKERFKDRRNHPEYIEIPRDEMVDFYRNYGAKKAAEKYGVTKRIIYNRLHEWGVELNNAQ